MLVADADLVLGERAKILDFGIAKLSVEMKKTLATSAMTQAGARLGTLAYMAPEQWMDPSTVDGRADVYALGVIAYELLLGRLPFGGAEVMSRMATPQELPPLDFPGIPRGLALLVTQMLALEPAGRPTMAQVAGSIARAGANAALGGRLQPMRVAVFAAGSALLLASLAAGSQLLATPATQSQPAAVEWTLTSEPSGAQVLDDSGERLGLTPFTYRPEPDRREPLHLRVALPGQPAREVSFDTTPPKSRRVHLQLDSGH